MRLRHVNRDSLGEWIGKPVLPATVVALRKQFGAELSRTLIEIIQVQPKAVQKFGAGFWMATARAIEQASDRAVANYKVGLIPTPTVVDLCGGIGGDAMAFAASRTVITVDRDAQMTRMAAHNLAEANAPAAAAVCADAMDYAAGDWLRSPGMGLHIDPDRRPNERRVADPDEYQPSLTQVVQLIQSAAASLVKLAPAALLPTKLCEQGHRQWISYAGSVREQTLLVGQCIEAAALHAGRRSAVKLLRDGTAVRFVPVGASDELAFSTHAEPQRYVFDLDPAVRAAGLSVAFATEHAIGFLGEPSGFATSDRCPESMLLRAYECLWQGPLDLKLIRRQIQRAGLYVASVKVRGTDHQPAALIKRLQTGASPSADQAVLLLGRTEAKPYAVLAKPVTA